jgi:hypothetical protein
MTSSGSAADMVGSGVPPGRLAGSAEAFRFRNSSGTKVLSQELAGRPLS